MLVGVIKLCLLGDYFCQLGSMISACWDPLSLPVGVLLSLSPPVGIIDLFPSRRFFFNYLPLVVGDTGDFCFDTILSILPLIPLVRYLFGTDTHSRLNVLLSSFLPNFLVLFLSFFILFQMLS